MTYVFSLPFSKPIFSVSFSMVMKTNKRQKRKKEEEKVNVKVVLLFDTATPYEEHQNFAISRQNWRGLKYAKAGTRLFSKKKKVSLPL